MNDTINGFLAWLGPILSALITSGGLAIINAKIASGEKKRDEARVETEAKRKAEAEWRERIEQRMDNLESNMNITMQAQQSNMRAQLIHTAEKYFSRGSITPEEHASWCDMHDRYSAMGFNGLIDTYRIHIDSLPHVTIDELAMNQEV